MHKSQINSHMHSPSVHPPVPFLEPGNEEIRQKWRVGSRCGRWRRRGGRFSPRSVGVRAVVRISNWSRQGGQIAVAFGSRRAKRKKRKQKNPKTTKNNPANLYTTRETRDVDVEAWTGFQELLRVLLRRDGKVFIASMWIRFPWTFCPTFRA